MSQHLAYLAVDRARLQQAVSTAASCGNKKWARESCDFAESLDRRISALKKCLRPEVVAEAREITNAPI